MWRLGLRPLDLADWIELDDDYAADLAVKATVRREHPDTVFVALPEALDACREVLDVLVDHLVGTWPQHFQRHGRQSSTTPSPAETSPLDGSIHPLDAASRFVQEDLVVMIEVGGELVFGAGSVCFPNRWDLRSKLGLPFRDVHAPVSLLNDQLGDTIDRFFDRLTPERSFWRLGWGVLDSVDLYQPLDGTAAPRPATPTPTIWWSASSARRCAVSREPAACCSRFAPISPRPPSSPPIRRHGPVIAEALAAMPPTGAPVQAGRSRRRGPRRAVRLTPSTAGRRTTQAVVRRTPALPRLRGRRRCA